MPTLIIFELCDNSIIYSLMETAKANSLRLDDYLLHLLSILPERAERNKDFEVDDLLPWSEEMKSWFSAVWVLRTTTFLYRGIIERLRRTAPSSSPFA